ncbi:FG-GAP-like repeat-containing protein [Zavarzinia sp.]|uniref:FG-GAP-like repeat-containing protein n=1 Tax=Zavarzinia sp. TaxID=2027920 RepID=UPI003BB4CC91
MTDFPATLQLYTLDGENGFRLIGWEYELSATAVAGVGDVNGDGFADIMVGSPLSSDYQGLATLVEGSAGPFFSDRDLSGPFFFGSRADYEYIGRRLGVLGDVNGDGFDDFSYGGDGGHIWGTYENYIVFGSAGGFVQIGTYQSHLDAAGDVNGDGFDDIIAGGTIVFGSASGLPANLESPAVDGSNGFQPAGAFSRMAAAGDVNGDGYDDLIFGNADTAGYVLFGKAGGFTATVDVTAVDGSNGYRITGAAGSGTGTSVGAAGDVNGDGIDDLIIGVGGKNKVYIVFGRADAAQTDIALGTIDGSNGFAITGGGSGAGAAGDVNGDGLADIIVGGGVLFGHTGNTGASFSIRAVDGSDGFLISGAGFDTRNLSINKAGDFNGDGFDDIAVGTPFADDPRPYYADYGYGIGAGITHVILGHAGDAQNWVGTSAGDFHVGSGDDDILKGARGNDHLKGALGDDILIGGSGSDILDGGAGSDTVSFAGSSAGAIVDLAAGTSSGTGLGNDTLIGIENVFGTGGADDISGDDGANRLDGGAGDDILRGRGGDDTYVVDSLGDTVVEAGDGGHDTMLTALGAYQLGANVEALVFTGVGAFEGTGNTLANTITGGAGDDVLNGGRGADLLRGLGGNDTYVVDDAGDAIEEAADGGVDTVQSTLSLTLGANIENLLLRGSARIDGTGNELDNVLTGNAANNILLGLGGDDALSGKAGNDKLEGGDGSDLLDGGSGDDRMYGGLGNDLYVVDSSLDVASEAHGDGHDTVFASASFTLGSGLDDLVITTSGAIDGTGNGAANIMLGGAGDNVLRGLGGVDILFGGRGDDRLDGGSGVDLMVGGAGNDTYVVDSYGDLVDESREAGGGGIDTVIYGGDGLHFVMAEGIENAILADPYSGHVTGNALANTITGDVTPDWIDGGAGDDTLTGGGADGGSWDNFVFQAGFGHDRITDFVANRNAPYDIITFADGLFDDFADVLAHSVEVDGDVVITYNAAHSIVLENVALSALTADSFQFVA